MKFRKKGFIMVIVSLTIILTMGVSYAISIRGNLGLSLLYKFVNNKDDDWEYNSKNNKTYSNNYSVLATLQPSSTVSSAVSDTAAISTKSNSSSESYLGYTVGGASNVDSFRQNIKNGYLPLSTDITYNGLYSEYYFDTGNNENSTDMFYPSYSFAVSTNPLSKEQEYYMSIGLNSNIKENDFKRDKINLVIVLDISGSMSSSFNSYYYDKKGNTDSKSKMKVAEECVNNLIDKLNPDDRLGIVLFDDQAYIGKRISMVQSINKDKLKEHVLSVEPQGGTNFSSGYELGTTLFEEYMNEDDYQNRIIVITDAMPNYGDISENGLTGRIEQNAKKAIYTSLIGVGVDFNTQLTEKLSDVRGSNYYSVHNSDEFNKILAEQFDYMVTPLVYDLNLSIESDYFKIENVYGSDSVDKTTGNIMHINTLFPSKANSNGEVKGGIVVLKLKRIKEADSNKISIKISYKDKNHNEYTATKEPEFKIHSEDYYDNLGIRKAIVLARYVNALKNWIIYERTQNELFSVQENNSVSEFIYGEEYLKNTLGINERASKKLTVNESYKKVFKELKKYIQSEKDILNEKDFENEIDILDILI